MAHKLTWLPEVLREAGLKVAEVEGGPRAVAATWARCAG
jgi:hypothetical protein